MAMKTETPDAAESEPLPRRAGTPGDPGTARAERAAPEGTAAPGPVRILQGDVMEQLKTLPDASVHCVVTSPPYWSMRSYLPEDHPLKPLELGYEKTLQEYMERMVAVFREVRRVLRDDGTCWLNMGDCYAGGGRGGNPADSPFWKQATNVGSLLPPIPVPPGLKPKDLVGMPWRLAFALQADGWWVRSDIIWHKLNPMPESCTDRPTKAHEYLFLLSKKANYFYDALAIAEPCELESWHNSDFRRDRNTAIHPNQGKGERNARGTTRQKRSVWSIPTQAFGAAHFAVFPEALVEPCLLAGTSAKGCCPRCAAPWKRVVKPTPEYARKLASTSEKWYQRRDNPYGGTGKHSDNPEHEVCADYVTLGWQPTCDCVSAQEWAPEPVPCTVLDPFLGSGTTAVVAVRHGRRCIGIELNPEYVRLAQRRLAEAVPLLLASRMADAEPTLKSPR